MTTRAGRSGLITGDAEPARQRKSENAKMIPKDSLLEFTLLRMEKLSIRKRLSLGFRLAF